MSCRLISDNTQIEEGAAAASEPVTITPLPIRERWLNNALDIAAASSESGAIAAVREAALSTAKAAQLPGRKDEAWRQTDFSALLATHMISAVETPGAALIEECVEGEAPGMRMVFVNGFFSAELSDLSALPEGVLAGSLASFESGAQSAALPLLQALPEDGQDKRTALGCYTWAAINQASLGDIACVRIAENVTVEEPLQIIFVSTGCARQPHDTPNATPPCTSIPAPDPDPTRPDPDPELDPRSPSPTLVCPLMRPHAPRPSPLAPRPSPLAPRPSPRELTCGLGLGLTMRSEPMPRCPRR